MSPWAERLARVRASVDRELAETLQAQPMVKSQYGGASADASRPDFDFAAVLVVGRGDEGNLSGGTSRSWLISVPFGQAEMQVDPDAWPACAALREGDRIVAPDRGDASFEIARVDGRRRNRLVFRLNVL